MSVVLVCLSTAVATACWLSCRTRQPAPFATFWASSSLYCTTWTCRDVTPTSSLLAHYCTHAQHTVTPTSTHTITYCYCHTTLTVTPTSTLSHYSHGHLVSHHHTSQCTPVTPPIFLDAHSYSEHPFVSAHHSSTLSIHSTFYLFVKEAHQFLDALLDLLIHQLRGEGLAIAELNRHRV